MLKIGDFSKLSRLSVRMLRHYDERGLLVPLSTDPFTGYRYYAEEQLAAAAHIAALRAMGFSLAEISALARQPDRDRLMEALAARRAQEAAALEAALADPATYQDAERAARLAKEYQQKKDEIDRLYQAWEALEAEE